MQSGQITIHGSKIYYETRGSGDPLVFVHADALDHRQWEEQVEYFADKYLVVTYDIRGFGKSEIPTDEPYSFSEDLALLMDHLQIDKAHLVGLSMGAAIIIDFALTHQNRVMSLTLADPGISGDGFSQDFKDAINKVIALAKENKLEEVKETWKSLAIFETSRANNEVWAKVALMVADTSCYRWYGTNQPINLSPLAAQRLDEIKVPTLVMVGEHDIADFQRKAKLLHEKISGSKFVTIPNSGHLSNMDNPEKFNEAFGMFLDSNN